MIFQYFLACGLVAAASATEVQQCRGMSVANLSEYAQLLPCKKPPCRLKKGSSTRISYTFIPDRNVSDVRNRVQAEVFGVPLPFVGVDGTSICNKIFLEDGSKASCPLKAGTKYTYKDSFPILSYYPSLSVKVHWALRDKNSDLTCFEVAARIS